MPVMKKYGTCYRAVVLLAALSLLAPSPTSAQTPPPPATPVAEPGVFNDEQLDALLAPIALYPDALLAQVLMATTWPLQVVEASRWLEVPTNKALSGDALTRALAKQTWDPSVKSLIPFPQVIATLNSKLDWMQQLGYAFATEQAAVMNSVQRLRVQAQAAGYLKTSEQQRVVMEKNAIIIEPASPQTVYVPVYSPTVVYGAWPYPSYPPVYVPPPPGYVAGNAFLSGLAFATGVAVVGSMWGWARPSWYGGNVNVNVNHYNNINVNRPPINSGVWRPPAAGVGGRPIRPPGGPVGAPGRPTPLPANAIGRSNVQISNTIVNKPKVGGGGNTVQGGTSQRLNTGQIGGSGVQRPSATPGNRPPVAPQQSARGGVNRPPVSGGGQIGGGIGGGAFNRRPAAAQRPSGAFGGVNDGARAGQFGARGAQSRAAPTRQAVGGGGTRGGARGGARGRG